MSQLDSHNSGSNFTVTIGVTPTLIKIYDTEPRISMALYNGSSQTIYLAYTVDSCDTTNGFPLFVGEKENEDRYHGSLYGIVSSSTAVLTVRVK